jgi:uncharacterized protein YcbK (DUF882 family)
MTVLTPNISRSEVACKCGKCKQDQIDFELVLVVQDAVDFFRHKNKANKAVLLITSANRCRSHNKAIGGAYDSQHIHSKAMDIVVKTYDGEKWHTVSPTDLAGYLDKRYPYRYGIGVYDSFTHIDVRADKARW